MSPQKGREAIFLGAGAGLTILVLLVLQSATSGGVFGTRTTSVTITGPAPSSSLSPQVSAAFMNHLLAIQSRNVAATVEGYAANAKVIWEGKNIEGPQASSYNGTSNIAPLYSELLHGAASANFTLTLFNSSVRAASGGASVNSTIEIADHSEAVGSWNATINVRASYFNAGNRWVISNETWDFMTFTQGFFFGCGLDGCGFCHTVGPLGVTECSLG